MSIEHVGMWVRDLERMVAFYEQMLGGKRGALYRNSATGFSSYFVSFDGGARLELMNRRDLGASPAGPAAGYAHVALSLGSREAVDNRVVELRGQAVTVESEPRVTGDGYYEAVVLDPEGNRVELMA